MPSVCMGIYIICNAFVHIIYPLLAYTYVFYTFIHIHLCNTKKCRYYCCYKISSTVTVTSYILPVMFLHTHHQGHLDHLGHTYFMSMKPEQKSYGDKCFKNAAPKVWNKLPSCIQQCDTLSKSKSNQHLFNESDQWT